MYTESGLSLRHLLSLRQKAIDLEAPQYVREAEALLNRIHPEWCQYLKDLEKVELKPIPPGRIPPAESTGFDFIAQANQCDPWLDRR
jgi:hypothetical protein